MKLEDRIKRLEAHAPPPSNRHVIIAAEGEEWTALDRYGRENIGDEDEVFLIALVGGRDDYRQPRGWPNRGRDLKSSQHEAK